MTPAVTLADLIADPQRAADLDRDQAVALLAQLAALSLALTVQLATAAPEPSENPNGALLTVSEVAELTRQSREWVWRRARRHDWARFIVKPSRKVLLVRRAGLLRWLASQGVGR